MPLMVMRSSGLTPSECPVHTAVASCGVKPTNHVFLLLLVVPVLPAAGRFAGQPMPPAVPPDLRTVVMAYVAVATTLGSTAWWQFGSGIVTGLPDASVMLVMATASQNTPLAASPA